MYEAVCYDAPFLKEVVARIDFVAPLEGLDRALPPKLANELSKEFPISEPVDAIARELRLGKLVEQHETRFKQWNFFGRERDTRRPPCQH